MRRPGRCSSCCEVVGLGIVFGVGGVLAVVGVVCVIVGSVDKEAVSSLSPETDFVMLDGACTIADYDVRLQTETETKTQGGRHVTIYRCHHLITYRFTHPGTSSAPAGAGPELYTSRVEKKTESTGPCPSAFVAGAMPFLGTFSKGSSAPCWRPSPGGPAPPASQYNCANTDCMKIFAPSEELSLANSEANVMIIIGAVLLVVGVVALGCAGWCCRNRDKCCRGWQSSFGSESSHDGEHHFHPHHQHHPQGFPMQAMGTPAALGAAAAYPPPGVPGQPVPLPGQSPECHAPEPAAAGLGHHYPAPPQQATGYPHLGYPVPNGPVSLPQYR